MSIDIINRKDILLIISVEFMLLLYIMEYAKLPIRLVNVFFPEKQRNMVHKVHDQIRSHASCH